jgi:hypothetical protein
VGIHTRVVEGAGEDRNRDRAGPAAIADGPVVIAALSGRDTAYGQPDDEKYRSDVHWDLRQHCLLIKDGWSRSPKYLNLVGHLLGSLPACGGAESAMRYASAFSRNLEVGAPAVIRL